MARHSIRRARYATTMTRARLRGSGLQSRPVSKLVALLLAASALGVLVGPALASPGAHPSHGPRLAFLLGHATVERELDSEAAGKSEAFPFTSARNGKAEFFYLYIDRTNRATAARTAIYSNVRGHPGALLTGGSTRHSVRGWNRIALRGVQLHRGKRYWIAVLGFQGTLAYRNRITSACRSQESAQKHLRRFPAHWKSGSTWPTCLLSAYVLGKPGSGAPAKRRGPAKPKTRSPVPRTGSPSSPGPTAIPPTSPGPTATPPTQPNCIAHLGACGYPDTSNTGVPANTRLMPSGSIVVSTPGAVISGLNVAGTIYVSADHVTVKDSLVTSSSPSSFAIHIDSGADGTVIEDSTIRGQDAGSGSVEYAVDNEGRNTQALRLQMSYCSECYAGAGLLKDSYAIANANVAGAHYEDIYYGGGGEALNVQHDTLLNPHDQTACVYGGTDFGPEQNLTINNNLLAGGGYLIYGGSGDPATRNVQVTNNRLSTVYFPGGGYYGVSAWFAWSVTTWDGNFWDDTLGPASGE